MSENSGDIDFRIGGADRVDAGEQIGAGALGDPSRPVTGHPVVFDEDLGEMRARRDWTRRTMVTSACEASWAVMAAREVDLGVQLRR